MPRRLSPFLLRGFDKVRGEWSLMALCYNFTRVLTITGLDRLIAYLAKRRAETALSPFWHGWAALRLVNAPAIDGETAPR
jgi:hypothetical protein